MVEIGAAPPPKKPVEFGEVLGSSRYQVERISYMAVSLMTVTETANG